MNKDQPNKNNKFWQSYNQFYHLAYNLISKSFDMDKESGLNDNILYSLTEMQISQYNLIELQTFQLSKEIKSKLSRFDQQQVSALLIKAKNILEELDRICRSLNIKFIFNLFQKLVMCLTIMISLQLKFKDSEQSQENSKAKGPKNSEKQIVKSQKQKNRKQEGHREKVQVLKTIPQEPEPNKLLKKIKLGGIVLYNENYKRHIENKQLTINIKQVLEDFNERKSFWKDIQNCYKETIGTIVEDKVCQSRQLKQNNQHSENNHKNIKAGKISQTVFSALKYQKEVEKEQKRLQFDQSFSINAYNTLHFSQIFSQELQSYDFSEQGLKKVIDDVSSLYKKEKIITLDSLKKVVAKFLIFYEEKARKMKQRLKLQIEKTRIAQNKLLKKYQNMRQIGIETLPCLVSQRLKNQVQKLKIQLNICQKTIKGLEDKLHKQNVQFVTLQKLNIQCKKKIEAKDKLLRQYQQKMCPIESMIGQQKQINANKQNNMDRQSKRLSFNVFKNWKKSQEILAQGDPIDEKSIAKIQSDLNLHMNHSHSLVKSRKTIKHINFNIPQKNQLPEENNNYLGQDIQNNNTQLKSGNINNSKIKNQNSQSKRNTQFCQTKSIDQSYKSLKKMRKKLKICQRTFTLKINFQFNSRKFKQRQRCVDCNNNLRFASYKSFQSFKDVNIMKRQISKTEIKRSYQSIFDQSMIQKLQSKEKNNVYHQLTSKSEKAIKNAFRQEFQDEQLRQKQYFFLQNKNLRANQEICVSRREKEKHKTIHCSNPASKQKSIKSNFNEYPEDQILREISQINRDAELNSDRKRAGFIFLRESSSDKSSKVSVGDQLKIEKEKIETLNKNMSQSKIIVNSCQKQKKLIFSESLNHYKMCKGRNIGQKPKKKTLRRTTPIRNQCIFQQTQSQYRFTLPVSQNIENEIAYNDRQSYKKICKKNMQP